MILYRDSLILIVHAACMISARLISGASQLCMGYKVQVDLPRDRV